MRYICKQSEPEIMKEWKSAQEKENLTVRYDIFPHKNELNGILRPEQHGICCYCQRRIDHYQAPLERGSHNEHLSYSAIKCANAL